MKEFNNIDYINYRIQKAEETFGAAKQLISNGFWNSSINRLYYACFYAVTALLIKDNISAKSHNGVKTQFFQNYIKNKKIDIKYGQLYSDLFDWPQKGDYNDFFDMSEKEVTPLINPVEEFIDTVVSLIKK